MTIVSLALAPGDTNAHQLSTTKIMATFIAVWPEDGSGLIRLGDSASQYGFAPYQFVPNALMTPLYDLSKIYYKLTTGSDTLCVVYGTQ